MDNISKQILFGISFRLTLTWISFSVIALIYGDQLIEFFLPVMTLAIKQIQSEFWPRLIISDERPGLIQMIATTRHSIPGIAVNGAKLTAGAHTTHALVPFSIFYSLLMAYPVKNFQHRLLLLALSLPCNWLLAAATVPFQLTGHIEMLFQDLAQKYSVTREKPFLVNWMLFLEVGGRWLIPILLACLNCWLLRTILSRNTSRLKIKRAKKLS